jgi:hypothetical protein
MTNMENATRANMASLRRRFTMGDLPVQIALWRSPQHMRGGAQSY